MLFPNICLYIKKGILALPVQIQMGIFPWNSSETLINKCKFMVKLEGIRKSCTYVTSGFSTYRIHLKKFINPSNLLVIATHKDRRRLFSACVSVWTEPNKTWRVWALIHKVLPRCFRWYGLWLTSQIIRSVALSDSVDISQSISINQFYPIEASIFIREFFVFP